MIRVRRAEPKDLEALVRLHQEVHELHLAHRPDQFITARDAELAVKFQAQLAAADVKVWVAELAEQVVGYAAAIHQQRAAQTLVPARNWCDIDNLGVSAPQRRQGVARALLQAVVDDAHASGLHEIELSSWAFNRNAHAAFQAFGFTPKVLRFELKR